MRIWDIEPKFLCKKCLLAEHNAIHRIWNIITRHPEPERYPPESGRWFNQMPALYIKHNTYAR